MIMGFFFNWDYFVWDDFLLWFEVAYSTIYNFYASFRLCHQTLEIYGYTIINTTEGFLLSNLLLLPKVLRGLTVRLERAFTSFCATLFVFSSSTIWKNKWSRTCEAGPEETAKPPSVSGSTKPSLTTCHARMQIELHGPSSINSLQDKLKLCTLGQWMHLEAEC